MDGSRLARRRLYPAFPGRLRSGWPEQRIALTVPVDRSSPEADDGIADALRRLDAGDGIAAVISQRMLRGDLVCRRSRWRRRRTRVARRGAASFGPTESPCRPARWRRRTERRHVNASGPALSQNRSCMSMATSDWQTTRAVVARHRTVSAKCRWAAAARPRLAPPWRSWPAQNNARRPGQAGRPATHGMPLSPPRLS